MSDFDFSNKSFFIIIIFGCDIMKLLLKNLDIKKNGVSVSTSQYGTRVSKSTKKENISVSSNGNVGVTLKTPIKSVKIKFNKKLFK